MHTSRHKKFFFSPMVTGTDIGEIAPSPPKPMVRCKSATISGFVWQGVLRLPRQHYGKRPHQRKTTTNVRNNKKIILASGIKYKLSLSVFISVRDDVKLYKLRNYRKLARAECHDEARGEQVTRRIRQWI